MPGSCDSDNNSSPSLLSSLRNFRFTAKKKYQSPPSTSASSSSRGTLRPNAPNSVNCTRPNGQLSPNNSAVNKGSPSPSTGSTPPAAKPPQAYNPLSYRKYEATTSSQFVLPCIITKFQQGLKRTGSNTLELELKLTNEELQKLKELILQDSAISEKWKRFVSHEAQSLESPCEKILKINRQYVHELLKYTRNVYNTNFLTTCGKSTEASPSIRTYARPGKSPAARAVTAPVATPSATIATNDQPDLNQLPLGQTKVIMDEYEVFCGKEQNLRKLLDAFPGADIMEAQDILVKCDWDLKKAIVVAQKQPLRCSKKKALANMQSAGDSALQNQISSADSHHSGSSRTSMDASMAEEIVLDSSDEETIVPANINKKNALENSEPRTTKRPRVLSSSDSDGSNSSKRTNTSPNPSDCVQKQQSATPNSNNDNKTYSISQSVTIKPVVQPTAIKQSQSVASPPNNIPNLPKGLVITSVVGSSPTNQLVTDKNTSESPSSIPSSNKTNDTNSNKSAQLVRIKTVNSTPSARTIDNASCSQSLTVTPVPKGVSITPVSNVNQDDDSNHSNANLQQSTKVSKSKSTKGKRKKYALDDEDDEEYGNDLIYDSEESDFEEENLTHAHSAVLKFFEESSPEDLGCIPGCSKKKVDLILALKPFGTWQNLVEKLGSDKYLSTDFLNGAKKVLDMRNAINKLMNKCQQISFDMEDLVENLKTNKESSSDYVGKQPELLNDRMHLTSYQMLGLNWLLLLHNQEVNGILADEMGLGKTVQAIAFLAYLKEISISGPHLIVVPSSTMDNWKQELKTWWPDSSVLCYHGSQDFRRDLRMQILNDEVDEFDIMITTYNMVTSSTEDRAFFKRLEFHYVIFDEAHMLKNMASQRYMHLMKIRAPRRLLLTGTPLQNNLVELMSLLIFAMPHMFSGKTEQIKLMFSSVTKSDGNKNTYEKDRIDHAKRIMKPFVLRRLKKDVLQDLPAKHDNTRICPMTEDQAKKYAELREMLSAEVQRNKEKDLSYSGSGMMMQLRRAANHPLLLRRFYDDKKLEEMAEAMLKEPTHTQSDPKLVWEDMSVMSDFELHKLCAMYKSVKPYMLSNDIILNSGKFKVLDSILPDLFDKKHRVLLFSQFTMVLDIVEEYMNIKEYKFFRLDGQTPVQDRQHLIDKFNNDPSVFVFLLSTRAGGLGINLTAADTVILHDIDFNPYNDKQAEDRCHRVGQTRDVYVHRLISENTIEEGILHRAKEKLKLEREIHESDDTEENDVASVAKLLRDALGLNNAKS